MPKLKASSITGAQIKFFKNVFLFLEKILHSKNNKDSPLINLNCLHNSKKYLKLKTVGEVKSP